MGCIIESKTSEDEIQCEFTVQAPRSRVWAALTTAEGWSSWFSEDIETDFHLGSLMRLDFGSLGECWGIVVERQENCSFAYRWHPGEDCAFDKYPSEEMTTVKFELADSAGGTQVTMTESGFAALPENRRFNALRLNKGGWEEELEELVGWLDKQTPQKLSATVVKRERAYQASLNTVWSAIATPAGLEGWFCKTASGTFAAGELVILRFDLGGIVEGPPKIMSYAPEFEFSYRWHPGRMEGCQWTDFPESQSTIVKFTIKEIEGGTHLQVVETGFENVAEDHRTTALSLNRQGWTECMDLIGNYVTA